MPKLTISDERIIAAQDAFIAKGDDIEFCKEVGILQEIHLRTDMKDDLDGAFTVAVEKMLAT